MIKVPVAFSVLSVVFGIIHIDKVTLDFDKKLSNWSITYGHDQTGNSVANVTFQLFDTVNRALLYLKANAAKDRNDRDCQIELVKTVIDVEKFLKGMQGNFLVRTYLDELTKFMDFEPKFPLFPVSY